MSSKLSLQALAFAGIIAVSGLPAFAAEMTPATPAPGAAVQSDMKAGVSGAGNSATVGTSTKADAKVAPGTQKDSKDLHKAAKDTKAAATKDVKTDVKTSSAKVQPAQTAKLPAASVPAPTATVNGSADTSVQH